MLKGVPKAAFKPTVEKHSCETSDQFDPCVFVLAKKIFSEERINHETECLRTARESLEDTMQ